MNFLEYLEANEISYKFLADYNVLTLNWEEDDRMMEKNARLQKFAEEFNFTCGTRLSNSMVLETSKNGGTQKLLDMGLRKDEF